MGFQGRSPYEPPAATVADAPSLASSRGVRAKWLYLGIAFPVTLLYVYIVGISRLTPAIAAAVAALSLLLLYFPLRRLFSLDSAPGPRWFSGLVYAIVAANLYGALANHAPLFLSTGIAFALMCLGIALAIAFVERRHGVLVYAQGRRFAFVPSEKP